MSARTAGPHSRTSPNRCVVLSGGTSAATCASNSGVEPRHRRPWQGARDGQVAVQVEEVALRRVQGSGARDDADAQQVPVGREVLSPGRTPVSTSRSRPSRAGLTSRTWVEPSATAPISANAATRVAAPVVVAGRRTSISSMASITSSRRTTRPAARPPRQVRPEVRLGVLGDPAGLTRLREQSLDVGGGRRRRRPRRRTARRCPSARRSTMRVRQPLRSRIGRAMSGLSTTNANIARSPQRPRNRWP